MLYVVHSFQYYVARDKWKMRYEGEKSRTLELQKSSFILKRELKRIQESVEPRKEAREAAKSTNNTLLIVIIS